MAERVSRRKLAEYVAAECAAGRAAQAIEKLAAHIVTEGRQRETDLIIRDIEDALANQGIVVADVTTAHGMTDELEAAVRRLIDAPEVVIREKTDPDVIGGALIMTPSKRYDGTVKHKINELRAQKM